MGLYDTLTFYQTWSERLKMAVGVMHNANGNYQPIINFLDYIEMHGSGGIHDAFVCIRRVLKYNQNTSVLCNLLRLIDAGLKNNPGFVTGVDRAKFVDVFMSSIYRMKNTPYALRAAEAMDAWLGLYPTSLHLRAAQMSLQAAAMPMQTKQLPAPEGWRPEGQVESRAQREPRPMAQGSMAQPQPQGQWQGQGQGQPMMTDHDPGPAQSQAPPHAAPEAVSTASAKLDRDVSKLKADVDAFSDHIRSSSETTATLEEERRRCQTYADRMERVITEWTGLSKLNRDTVHRYVEAHEAANRALHMFDVRMSQPMKTPAVGGPVDGGTGEMVSHDPDNSRGVDQGVGVDADCQTDCSHEDLVECCDLLGLVAPPPARDTVADCQPTALVDELFGSVFEPPRQPTFDDLLFAPNAPAA